MGRGWDADRLKIAIEHATEVAQSSDIEECAQNHAELADWLTELQRLRELPGLVNAVEMLLAHDDPYSDLGKLARASVRSVLERWRLTCSGLLKPDATDWRQAIEDCFGAIPEGIDAEGWFKHQVGELRGKLSWTEKALEARKQGDPEVDLVGRQQVVERVLSEQFHPLRVFADEEAFKDGMSHLAEHVVEALDGLYGDELAGVKAQRDAYKESRDEFSKRLRHTSKELDKVKKHESELVERIYRALIDLGCELPKKK